MGDGQTPENLQALGRATKGEGRPKKMKVPGPLKVGAAALATGVALAAHQAARHEPVPQAVQQAPIVGELVPHDKMGEVVSAHPYVADFKTYTDDQGNVIQPFAREGNPDPNTAPEVGLDGIPRVGDMQVDWVLGRPYQGPTGTIEIKEAEQTSANWGFPKNMTSYWDFVIDGNHYGLWAKPRQIVGPNGKPLFTSFNFVENKTPPSNPQG